MARTSAPRSSGSISSRYIGSILHVGKVLRKSGRGEFILKLGRLLANFQPIEESVGRFQPDGEPVRDFLFFGALVGVHFVIARNHFRAAPAETCDFADAFGGGLFVFEQEFSQELIEAHQAHFGFFESGEMQQVGEFFFVAAFGIGARGPHHAHSCFFEHADDVVGRGFSLGAELRDQLAANLFDFRGGIARLGQGPGRFQDHRLLCGRTAFIGRA